MREETTRRHQNSSSREARKLTTFRSSDSLNNEKMIKYVILISTLACLAYSQRPPYSGSAGRYPLVLPQYTTTPKPSTPDLANRIDSINGSTSTTRLAGPAFAAAVTTPIPQDLPIEVNGDRNLLNMIMTWPKDKQPFWLINQQHINAHLGAPNVPGTATQAPQTPSRSFFAG